MTPEHWQQVKALLAPALELEVGQRGAYLDRVCGADSSLREDVDRFLAADANAGTDFLNSAVRFVDDAAEDNTSSESWIGRRVGQYRIEERIALGGMGEVYRAIRADDQYDKNVAIKLVRTGQDISTIISRFTIERQILANLDHPNIARMLDGGSIDGRPYFVMELIEGLPIDQYCNEHRLAVPQRLQLFVRVCSAVQYAHQHLIIHRDLKPGNILVTEEGEPKLLDFGIAKILIPDSARQTEPTVTSFQALTPAYASPEQVRQQPMTTASDVYSLGVVLYELLTGLHPYRSSTISIEEQAYAICHSEPERPSTAVRRAYNAHAKDGRNGDKQSSYLEPANLSKQLRGDLDNILLMTLRKEPSRRYASVEQFAGDITRHLMRLPVTAHRDTFRYRASKFVTRHKAGVLASAMAILVFVAAFVITMREARIAQRRFNDVRALANSLIFDVHDAIRDLPGSTPARKVIVDRALQYLNALEAESNHDISLERELAAAYERVGLVQGHYLQDNLGDTAGSLNSYEKALELRKRIAARSRDWHDGLGLAQAYRVVGDLQWSTGAAPQARTAIDRAIGVSEALNRDNPNDPTILYELGYDYSVSRQIGYPGDPDGDVKLRQDLRKAIAADQAALTIKPDDVSLLHAYAVDLSSLGGEMEASDPRGALVYYERILDIERGLTRRSNAVKYARQVAIAYEDIAGVYDALGDYSRVVENDDMALAAYQQLNRKDPKNATLRQGMAIAYANTASALAKVGRTRLALEESNESVNAMRSVVAASPHNIRQREKLAEILLGAGQVYMHAHRPLAALKQFKESLDIYLSLQGSSEQYRGNIAGCQEKLGEAAAAAGDDQAAARYFQAAMSELDPRIARTNADIGDLYAAADSYSGMGDLTVRMAKRQGHAKGAWSQARHWYSRSLETWRRIPHPSHSGPNGVEVGDPVLVAQKLRHADAAFATH